jgi:hypothetical protein
VLPPPLPCALPEDRGQPDRGVSWSKALKWTSTYFAVAFAIDASAGMFTSGSRWDPFQPFVPSIVCAALSFFVILPRLYWPSASAGAVRKVAAG